MKNHVFHIFERIYNLQDSLSELVSLSETFMLSKSSLMARIALSELVMQSKLFPLNGIALSELVLLSELFPLGGITLSELVSLSELFNKSPRCSNIYHYFLAKVISHAQDVILQFPMVKMWRHGFRAHNPSLKAIQRLMSPRSWFY